MLFICVYNIIDFIYVNTLFSKDIIDTAKRK